MVRNYRMVLLVLATGFLSMMMANILTLNFCILCMTDEKFAYEDLRIQMDKEDNFTALESECVSKIKNYIMDAAEGDEDFEVVIRRNISRWRDIKIDDIALKNITQDLVASLQKRVLLKKADHEFDSRQRSVLFAAVAVGALMAIFPISSGIQHFGSRKSFTIVGIIAGTSTALCPVAASFGMIPFVVMRMLQGVGYAACLPIIGSVTSSWASLSENGLFSGALTSFIQIGPVITMPMSGLLCSSPIGWQSVFYVHAALTFIFVALWWLFYSDSPRECGFVTPAEAKIIEDGKVSRVTEQHNEELPLCEIYSNTSAWAVWIAAIGNMYSINMVIVFAPIYMNQVLGLSLVDCGFAAALPTLVQFVVKMIAGSTSDRIGCLGETAKVRIYNSIAFIGMAIFLIVLGFVPGSKPMISLICLIGSASILGFNTGGFFKSATLIGRQYSHFINANVQVIMCIAMLTVPFIVFSLTPNGTNLEWQRVFLLHAGLLVISNVVFCCIGQGEAASFTISTRKTESGRMMLLH